MTIDEEIKKLKDGSYLTNSEESKIADWLEELKIYRESSYGELHDMIYSKAIDDLMEKVSECFITDEDWDYLLQESEKLKDGGENDD